MIRMEWREIWNLAYTSDHYICHWKWGEITCRVGEEWSWMETSQKNVWKKPSLFNLTVQNGQTLLMTSWIPWLKFLVALYSFVIFSPAIWRCLCTDKKRVTFLSLKVNFKAFLVPSLNVMFDHMTFCNTVYYNALFTCFNSFSGPWMVKHICLQYTVKLPLIIVHRLLLM